MILVLETFGPMPVQRQSHGSRLSCGLLCAEPFAVEVFLTICSGWAARCLLLPFDGTTILSPVWGVLALAAFVLKAAGLSLTWNSGLATSSLSIMLRCIGLALSVFLWDVIGISLVMANPDNVLALPPLVLGVSGIWVLARGPTIRRR